MKQIVILALGVAICVTALACSESSGPEGDTACKQATPDDEIPIEISPSSDRVDLDTPSFSNPTSVSNPLFPISQLHSAILLGTHDGARLRVETTLLDGTQTIDLGEEEIEVSVSQYMALIDGRIAEVALDWYGQADDGSVWYFGEDVFNYEQGVLADTDGTWITCEDGPAAMIMPADPQVGDVYRPENAYPIVFEEVVVKAVGQTVSGPTGPVAGAITVEELHMDGTRENKIFAPGYGEFSTGAGANEEAVALAVPTDALVGPPPGNLVAISDGAYAAFDAAGAGDWSGAATASSSISAAWAGYKASGVPSRLAAQLDAAQADLEASITATDVTATLHAALDVVLAASDFELRYRPRVEIDFVRLDAWARRLQVDLEASDLAGIASDVAIIGWVWDRLPHPEADPSPIGMTIAAASANVASGNLDAVARAARDLRRGIRERTEGSDR